MFDCRCTCWNITFNRMLFWVVDYAPGWIVRGYSIAPPSITSPCEGPNKKLRLDMLDSMVGFPQFIRLYFHTQAKQLSSSLVPWDFGLLSLTQRCADGAIFLGPVPCICGFLQRHRWMRPQHQGWQRWTVAAYVLVYLIWLQTLGAQWRLITSGNEENIGMENQHVYNK